MANNLDQFKPQAGGIGQAPVRLNSGPQLGKHFALTASPMTLPQPSGAPSAPPMVQTAVGAGQSPISSPQAPKGAQPVALVGSHSPLQQQMPSMPMSPNSRPAMGQSQPSPFLTKTPPQAPQQPQGNYEVHRISIIGLGNDGKKYLVEFDAAFPVPAEIQDISEKLVQG